MVKWSTYIWLYLSSEQAEQASTLLASLGGVTMPVTGIAGKMPALQEMNFEILRGGIQVFQASLEWATDIIALVESEPYGTGIAFYTWNNVDSLSFAKVGFPDPPPATLGTSQLTVLPGGGGDFTDSVAEISFEVESPAWELDLQPGDVFHITFHASGFLNVMRQANLSVRTILGGVPCVVRDPRVGTTWTFYVGSGGIQVAASRRTEDYTAYPAAVSAPPHAADPVVFPNPAGFWKAFRHGATLWCVTGGSPLVHVCRSRDEGSTWTRLMAITNGVDLLAVALSEDGGRFYGYGRATAPRGATVKAGDVVRIILTLDATQEVKTQTVGPIAVPAGAPALPTRNVAGIVTSGHALYVVEKSANAVRMYRSTDELATLTELVA